MNQAPPSKPTSINPIIGFLRAFVLRILPAFATGILRAIVRVYQVMISPILPGSCRFYPTCSSYALEALDTHGPVKGGWMGLKRITRCHPWNDGGMDPVPPGSTHGPKHGSSQEQHSCCHSD